MKNQKEQKNKTEIISKKPYKKPQLISLGDIRDVTMGGSPGVGDSGGGTPENFV